MGVLDTLSPGDRLSNRGRPLATPFTSREEYGKEASMAAPWRRQEGRARQAEHPSSTPHRARRPRTLPVRLQLAARRRAASAHQQSASAAQALSHHGIGEAASVHVAGAKPPTKGGAGARKEARAANGRADARHRGPPRAAGEPAKPRGSGLPRAGIDAVNAEEIRVLVHPRSGDRHANGDKPRSLSVDGAAAAPWSHESSMAR